MENDPSLETVWYKSPSGYAIPVSREMAQSCELGDGWERITSSESKGRPESDESETTD